MMCVNHEFIISLIDKNTKYMYCYKESLKTTCPLSYLCVVKKSCTVTKGAL